MRQAYPDTTALRCSAVFMILRIGLAVAALVVGACAFAFDPSYLFTALVLVAASVAAIILGFVSSFSLKCPHCRSHVFLCASAVHPRAKSVLGSRLIGISLDILFSTSFRCIYCGERCACRDVSKKSRCRHGQGTARQCSSKLRTPAPSSRTVSRVLARPPAARGMISRWATHGPENNLTCLPAPRTPYPEAAAAAATAFDHSIPDPNGTNFNSIWDSNGLANREAHSLKEHPNAA